MKNRLDAPPGSVVALHWGEMGELVFGQLVCWPVRGNHAVVRVGKKSVRQHYLTVNPVYCIRCGELVDKGAGLRGFQFCPDHVSEYERLTGRSILR